MAQTGETWGVCFFVKKQFPKVSLGFYLASGNSLLCSLPSVVSTHFPGLQNVLEYKALNSLRFILSSEEPQDAETKERQIQAFVGKMS